MPILQPSKTDAIGSSQDKPTVQIIKQYQSNKAGPAPGQEGHPQVGAQIGPSAQRISPQHCREDIRLLAEASIDQTAAAELEAAYPPAECWAPVEPRMWVEATGDAGRGL